MKLLENLTDTLYASQGVGLAAPQIGISKRVAVVDIGDGLFELINPVIIERYGEEIDKEGCLSIPGIQGEVKRSAKVVVQCQDREGNLVQYAGEGFLARAFQHEIDHLDGVLFVDLAPEVYKV